MPDLKVGYLHYTSCTRGRNAILGSKMSDHIFLEIYPLFLLACAGAARARLSAFRECRQAPSGGVARNWFSRVLQFSRSWRNFYRQLNPIGKRFFMQAPPQVLLPRMRGTSVRLLRKVSIRVEFEAGAVRVYVFFIYPVDNKALLGVCAAETSAKLM